MKEIGAQFLKIWRELKLYQKISILITLIVVSSVLFYSLIGNSKKHYVPLFPVEHLSCADQNAIREFLEQARIPFYETTEEGILVPEEWVGHARMEVGALGIPKLNQTKGFELFDTNTWIKGEKELQVLEMRALKGQLERDIAQYENIKSATVILDLAPARTFGNSAYKTKTSVILTLMPGAHLGISQLRAITYHLAGAVRGLEPNMIAISDTTGRLYKAIDPDNVENPFSNSELFLEEQINEKIEVFLDRVLGKEHYFLTGQLANGEEEKNKKILMLNLTLDKNLYGEAFEELKEGLAHQIKGIVEGFGLITEPHIHSIPFEKRKSYWIEKKEKMSFSGVILTSIFILCAVSALVPLFRSYGKKKNKQEDAFAPMMTRLDMEKLARSIKNEDPETIAFMLSYLEPKRAEDLLASLPSSIQTAVLREMEKEDV